MNYIFDEYADSIQSAFWSAVVFTNVLDEQLSFTCLYKFTSLTNIEWRQGSIAK